MRRHLRSPRASRTFATQPWTAVVLLILAASLLPAPAGAQAPRILTLDEAGRDPRVEATLGLMVHRAQVEADVPMGTEVALPAETGGFANFHPARMRPETPVALIIEGTPDRAELESRGIVVGTVAGDVVTATMPLSLLPALLEVEGIVRVAPAAITESALNVSAYEIDANEAWGGNPPSYPAAGLTGLNVIIGMVDTGSDPRHADLRDAANRTRFKWIWDQQWSGTPPAGYGYGSEYSESQINAGTVLVNYHDFSGHGTHLAGVAAGNGRATGNGQAAYRYVGIAPEASIIAVKAYTLETQVIDAVRWVFQKSTALARPCVVNLSMSVTNGARDGTYSFDRALSALTGPGKIITAAAGNKGLENGHARYELANTANTDVTFTIPTYTPSITQHEALVVEGWHDSGGGFDVKLISPTGITSPVFTPGQTSGQVITNDGTYIIDNARTVNQLGAKQIMVFVGYGQDGTARPRPGGWKINIKRRSGTTTGTSHWWIAQTLFGSTTLPAFTGAGIDTATTITSPASADSIISSGSYTTKVQWQNAVGSTSKYPYSPPLWKLSDFTSRGPRRDGQQRPDVMAPGYGVMAATAVDAQISETFKDPDRVHHMGKGTSVANAHTTGTIALLMEQNPNLTPSGARLILRQRARSDQYTGSVPNGKWGYGKLDATAGGTTAVNDGIAPGLSFANVYPNPSQAFATFEFNVSAVALAQGSSTPVQLRIIDVAGREVARISGAAVPGSQRLSWDGRNSEGQNVAAGVYFARLTVGTTQLQKKFVRIDP